MNQPHRPIALALIATLTWNAAARAQTAQQAERTVESGWLRTLQGLESAVAPYYPQGIPFPETESILPNCTEKEDIAEIEPPATEPPAGRQASDREWAEYLLGPGDGIQVVVQPPFSELSVQGAIGPQGSIIMPLVGEVDLWGLTPETAQRLITARLNEFLVDPVVSFTLLGRRPVQIAVTGEVARPGFFTFPPDVTVASALINTGGTTLEADLRRVRLRRTLRDGATIERTINLYDPLESGVAFADLRLQDGDVVFIPTRRDDFDDDYDRDLIARSALTTTQRFPIEITITGDVTRPGYYDFNAVPPPQIPDILVAAGGSQITADLRQVEVYRTLANGNIEGCYLDLFTPLVLGEKLPEFPLENRDVVVVPRLEEDDRREYDRRLAARSSLARQDIVIRVLSYAAGGGVTSPVSLPSGSTLADALTGIPLSQARLGRIALIRFDPERGRAITYELDGREALRGDPDENILLEHNDAIVVDRNLIAQVSYTLNTFTQPFRDVLGFLLFFDQLTESADNLFRSNGIDNNNNR